MQFAATPNRDFFLERGGGAKAGARFTFGKVMEGSPRTNRTEKRRDGGAL